MSSRFSCLALDIGLIAGRRLRSGQTRREKELDARCTADDSSRREPKPQTIKVDFEADNPVIVLVVKDADLSKDDDGGFFPANKPLAASKSGEKKGEFSAELPANTAARVVARASGGKATIKLHVTNQ